MLFRAAKSLITNQRIFRKPIFSHLLSDMRKIPPLKRERAVRPRGMFRLGSEVLAAAETSPYTPEGVKQFVAYQERPPLLTSSLLAIGGT
jgi:hypothetical protein